MTDSFNILGINYGGHDTSAALSQNGELVAACEQERYTLDKHSRRFPTEAIEDCLKSVGISFDDVDEVAFAFKPLYHIQEAYLRPALSNSERIGMLVKDIERIEENLRTEELIREKTGFTGPINYYHHHHCHLASTWYPSGFEEALVVSYDGIGEIETGLLATGRTGSLDIFHNSSRYPDSLGLLYSAITHYLGWRHHCDEGIVMGLACYGDAMAKVPGDGRSYYEIFEEIVQEIDEYNYCIHLDWIDYHRVRDKWVSDNFCSVFGKNRAVEDPVTDHHKNIAAALQLRLEKLVLKQLSYARKQTQLNRLCLSGGVALNCSLNGKIEQSRLFDEIFVQPASGDAGVAIGACYLGHKAHHRDVKPQKMHNFYLGSSASDQEVEQVFLERNLVAKRLDSLLKVTADRLADGKIVGWFQGRAEFGPRALGNRSILTRPYPTNMKDYLNSRVKFREEFRPFAPSILYEHMHDYFELDQESPHMLIACEATEKAKKEIPATVHVDGSCRVQTVRRENNGRFFELLSAFYLRTGCPVLLNTSFNVKGQPIVNTPLQAVDCYLSTNIDCLVINDWFVEKGN